MAEEHNGQNPFEGWTTIQHAARMLKRDDTVLRYWVKKGYIQAYEIAPRLLVVNLEEISNYAASHKSHREND